MSYDPNDPTYDAEQQSAEQPSGMEPFAYVPDFITVPAGTALTVVVDTPGVNAVLTLTPSDVTADGGDWTIAYNGAQTAPIPFDDDGTLATAAMEALETVGAGNVVVTGSLATVVEVAFAAALGGQVIGAGLLTADGSGLEGDDAPYAIVTAVDTAGVATVRHLEWAAPSGAIVPSFADAPNGAVVRVFQDPADANAKFLLTPSAAPEGGTFTITFDGDTTTALAWDAGENAIEAALEALASIGAGNVSVNNDLLDAPIEITFIGDLGNQPLAEELMTADGGDLTGAGDPYTITAALDTPGVTGGEKSLVWGL